LYAATRQAPGGLIQQAIAAIENALVDIKAKSLGVSVASLLNGPVRQSLRLYWSHCGSYRLQHSDVIGCSTIHSLNDIKALGAEVREKGFSALKTNIFELDQPDPYMYQAGFTASDGWPELNIDRHMLRLISDQMEAFREGAGDDVDLLLDLNFNFKTEGYLEIARAVEAVNLMWIEIDLFDPAALSHIRSHSRTPVASCESLFGRRQFRPYLDNQAMDVAIIDVPWNGILESMKIASMCEAYEVNCAPHNFYGNLSTMMSANFCAAIPNFRIMEIDIDDVPWKDEVVTAPEIKNGHLILNDAPGWGVEVNEAAIKAHPVKT